MSLGGGLPGAFPVLVFRGAFPNPLLESAEMRKGLGAGTDGGEVFFKGFFTTCGVIEKAGDFFGPIVVSRRFGKVVIGHAAGLGDVFESVAIDIDCEDGAESAGSLFILAD